jgi:hypothetical protein
MGIELALVKLMNGKGTDLRHSLTTSDIDLRTEVIYGTAGNATGEIEYVGYSLPDTTLSQPLWQIVKVIYDANGNAIRLIYANGTDKYDKVMNACSTYTYVES